MKQSSNRWKSRLVAAVIAVGALLGVQVAAVAPAHAFATIWYHVDCPPGSDNNQRLYMTNNYSGSKIGVGGFYYGTTTQLPGYSHYVYPNYGFDKVYYRDKISYRFTGAGSLNWSYTVYCRSY